MTPFLETETILDDDYPVHFGYVYLADGRAIRSSLDGTVRTLKKTIGAKEIRKCDMFAETRAFMKIGERV